jgi:hypothetical protein
MKNFIVHVMDMQSIFSDEKDHLRFTQRLQDLMREDLLQQVYQSESQDQMWMVWRIEDLELMKLIIQPMSVEWSFDFQIIPLRRNF